MGWKRIMSKENKQIPRESLEYYFSELIPELNLRLLMEELETPSAPSARILWVEGTTVTAYEAAPVKDLLRISVFSDPLRKIMNRLMGRRKILRP